MAKGNQNKAQVSIPAKEVKAPEIAVAPAPSDSRYAKVFENEPALKCIYIDDLGGWHRECFTDKTGRQYVGYRTIVETIQRP